MAPLTRSAARLRRDEAGQSLVELALIAPVLILLILGSVEFARAWHAYHALNDTARQAARQAALSNTLVTQDSVLRLVRNTLRASALDPAAAVVTISRTGETGTPTSVAIRYPYTLSFLGPFGVLVNGKSQITLSTQAVMRHE